MLALPRDMVCSACDFGLGFLVGGRRKKTWSLWTGIWKEQETSVHGVGVGVGSDGKQTCAGYQTWF
jgi:hypothetical protein